MKRLKNVKVAAVLAGVLFTAPSIAVSAETDNIDYTSASHTLSNEIGTGSDNACINPIYRYLGWCSKE
ncbi:hypothetical protein [Pseudoalteromonas sp. P1-8]|uniref:hypothetical protein n=1 Tax=Pseudoalteromonas sp. P1-8 TaxID=1710353 RepID=UPI0006DC275E|nr:hypothetical protein [Pseudoalteromonas sp. P1-8]KPW01075.1 hypothetical protein AN213_02107 [Pseudoalteromonas sp. P1-8]